MTLAGSQTNGYSRAAIPSVEAAIAQPTCTIRQISQAMKLMGRRSTRAAISPGMTRVPPPRRPRLPRYLVPLRFSLLPSSFRGWRVKRGITAAFAADVEGARVAAGDAGHQAVAVAGFGAGENIGMASMPLPLPWRVTAKLYEIPGT